MGRRGKNLPAALCNALGTLLLLLVIAACLPVPLAHMAGYEVYNVVSGSMEPSIPVGSAIFVRRVRPSEIEEGDVIAFYRGDAVVTHRAVENDPDESSIVTKGDANAEADREAARYSDVIGVVTRHVPRLGALLEIYTGGVGRWYVIGVAAAGALLNLSATGLRARGRRTDEEKRAAGTRDTVSSDFGVKNSLAESGTTSEGRAAEPQGEDFVAFGTADAEKSGRVSAPDDMTPALKGAEAHSEDSAVYRAGGGGKNKTPAPSGGAPVVFRAGGGAIKYSGRARKKRGARIALIVCLAAVFTGSLAAIAVISLKNKQRQDFYTDAADRFVSAAPAETGDAAAAPIAVDFDALRAVNGDIVGWLYCEDTEISYPVLKGADNDTYLRHDYENNYTVAGSIFVEEKNRDGFADANTIIYGHHMNDGTMFACLEMWQQQAFADAHPEMWLLTPEVNYRIRLFSAYRTNAYSETYTVFTGPCDELDAYLEAARGRSVVSSDVELSGDERFVVLSTCAEAYGGGDERSVVHGVLVAADRSGV